MASLLVQYFNPDSDNDVRQTLSLFFPAYAFSSTVHQARIASCLPSVLAALLQAKANTQDAQVSQIASNPCIAEWLDEPEYYSSWTKAKFLADIDITDVAKYLFYLTDATNLHQPPALDHAVCDSLHARAAVSMTCLLIAGQNFGAGRYFPKLFNMLSLEAPRGGEPKANCITPQTAQWLYSIVKRDLPWLTCEPLAHRSFEKFTNTLGLLAASEELVPLENETILGYLPSALRKSLESTLSTQAAPARSKSRSKPGIHNVCAKPVSRAKRAGASKPASVPKTRDERQATATRKYIDSDKSSEASEEEEEKVQRNRPQMSEEDETPTKSTKSKPCSSRVKTKATRKRPVFFEERASGDDHHKNALHKPPLSIADDAPANSASPVASSIEPAAKKPLPKRIAKRRAHPPSANREPNDGTQPPPIGPDDTKHKPSEPIVRQLQQPKKRQIPQRSQACAKPPRGTKARNPTTMTRTTSAPDQRSSTLAQHKRKVDTLLSSSSSSSDEEHTSDSGSSSGREPAPKQRKTTAPRAAPAITKKTQHCSTAAYKDASINNKRRRAAVVHQAKATVDSLLSSSSGASDDSD
eukprot:TRINITY_DN7352_c0_g1_i1.p2 TRINITY_DN7352_c0_g1~~TRINITY_DN7352_c0_g1_i1.p2  ORF type:complete len:583 (-),score=73.99 TRINITY_DN7352_c0_g1_i1:28-1776(-)